MELSHLEIENYCAAHSSLGTNLQQDLIKYTEGNIHGSQMLSGIFQGTLLTIISKSIQPLRILEIGTFTGFSALCLAEGLRKDGNLISFEIDKKLKSVHDQFIEKSSFADKIEIIYGDVNIILPTMKTLFDLVYIDGSKKDYPSLFNLCLEKLAPNGSILVDNVLWKGKVLPGYKEEPDKNTAILKDFNNTVSGNEKLLKILLPIRDGLYWIMKKE